MNEQNTQDNGALAAAITKALAYTENGGKPDVGNPSAGKTGEMKSIFQFEPATWASDAKEFLGSANAPLTPDSETTVVMRQVNKWLQEGKTVPQIASMWNAGQGEPDAYTGKFSDGNPSIGVNKQYGVKFNVPAYAESVESYTKQFMQEQGNQGTAQGAQGSPQPQTLSSIQQIVQQAQSQHPPQQASVNAPQSQVGGAMGQAMSTQPA